MTKDVTERVSVLEHALTNLSENLKDWQNETRISREAFVAEFKAIRTEITGKSSGTDWKSIGAAIIMTASVMSAVLTGLNFWYAAKATPTEEAVKRIEQQLHDQSPAVLKYRVDEMERKLRVENPKF